MRVNDRKDSRQLSGKTGGTLPRKSGGGDGTPFVSAINRMAKNQSDYNGRLLALKEEIDRAGDALDHQPTIANFKIFRDLLGTLARTVSADAYRMELVNDPTSPKVLEVLTVIDHEADTLYHLVIKDQKDHIRITGQIMKIKGLVVDYLL
jgi:uncharacterized protein YaaR (DUF327 family)